MTNSNNRIIGGCCVEGICQLKNSPDEKCWDVIGPPADMLCGYDAWLNYQGDGNCERVSSSSLTTSTVVSTDPITTATEAAVASTSESVTIPTTQMQGPSSTIATMELNEYTDYSICNFSCCTNDGCKRMVDSENRVLGGCCVEGQCQIKSSPRDICSQNVFADAVGGDLEMCGYDSWVSFKEDGCNVEDPRLVNVLYRGIVKWDERKMHIVLTFVLFMPSPFFAIHLNSVLTKASGELTFSQSKAEATNDATESIARRILVTLGATAGAILLF